MTRKRIAARIKQEVQQPTESTDNKSTNNSSAIATTQNIAIADLQLTSQGLFDESKALWNEFIAFDQEHQLAQRVGAQLWRLTKAIGKPALVLSLKGIQTAVVTVANADKRTALIERFRRSQTAQAAGASLESTED
ncbi:MAG: hypothetical protein DCF15_21695 [Phormidesmis priestleyi]|uniref:Uncharacterized protein n=1 Tax=Phormidesmis priestleyi TaxID=268141 RepID=A0A2W4WQ09_9CYAN|nr:MAG: hypothetical protein DCF15_21695 [Phormidesmis priestleyi]